MSIRGEGGEGLDTSPHAIDRDHIELARRCEEPGWLEAEPQFLLLPDRCAVPCLSGLPGTGGSSVTGLSESAD